MLPSFVMNLLEDIKKDAALTAPVKNAYVVFGELYDSLATTSLHKKSKNYIKISIIK